MSHLVFVYGTLKTGHYNHRALQLGGTSKLIFDDAFIKGKMYSLGAYPAVVPVEKLETKDQITKGEVWMVDDETLDRLDHLEGHPRFYVRTLVDLLNGAKPGGSHVVWAYLMPKESLPKRAVPMPVGNWPSYK